MVHTPAWAKMAPAWVMVPCGVQSWSLRLATSCESLHKTRIYRVIATGALLCLISTARGNAAASKMTQKTGRGSSICSEHKSARIRGVGAEVRLAGR